MEILFIVGAAIFIVHVVYSQIEANNVKNELSSYSTSTEKTDYKESIFEIDSILDGYEVYEDSTFFVQGVTYKFESCIKWAKGENHKIYFKREPNNKHDSNAIAVYGKSSTGRRKIGYIASEIADDLVYRELDDKIKARLINIEIKDVPFIEYEILVESKAYNSTK